MRIRAGFDHDEKGIIELPDTSNWFILQKILPRIGEEIWISESESQDDEAFDELLCSVSQVLYNPKNDTIDVWLKEG